MLDKEKSVLSKTCVDAILEYVAKSIGIPSDKIYVSREKRQYLQVHKQRAGKDKRHSEREIGHILSKISEFLSQIEQEIEGKILKITIERGESIKIVSAEGQYML